VYAVASLTIVNSLYWPTNGHPISLRQTVHCLQCSNSTKYQWRYLCTMSVCSG